MKKEYRVTNRTISLLCYHFVFCPRYRRKIFSIPNVTERFKELVEERCEKQDIQILAIECEKDYAYLFLNSVPDLGPADIMWEIKQYTSRILREEFQELSKMPSLWTKNFFVSTEEKVDREMIVSFVEGQRKRY